MPFFSSARKQFGPQGRKNTGYRAYQFASHTFTNAGATGPDGPSLAQCRSAYSSAQWAQGSNLNMSVNGIQLWTVPQTGWYRIAACGARGGIPQNGYQGYAGGFGALMVGTFRLYANEVIKIAVGQQGVGGNHSQGGGNAGGGGGTFVTRNDNSILVIAGGGGGGYGYSGSPKYGINASTGPDGVRGGEGNGGSGGTGGDGGYNNSGNAGAGYSGNGRSDWSYSWVAQSFLNGARGGAMSTNWGDYGEYGGFGGGSGASLSAGAGGGYSGGGAGTWSTWGNGGGGGSLNNGASQSNSISNQDGHGYVTITKL